MFLTLRSDESLHYFPENTPGTFIVRLPETVSLVGEWEIGLIDIFIPKTWHNVKEGEMWVKCFADREYTFHVPAGYYPNVFSLVPTIHLLFRSVPHLAIAMNFDHITSRAAFVISRGRDIQMSARLANLLGFGTFRLQSGWHTCPWSADLDENILFVYCDLVQDIQRRNARAAVSVCQYNGAFWLGDT